MGLFTQFDMLQAPQFDIHPLHLSIVVALSSFQNPLLCLFSISPITSCQVRVIPII